MDQVGGGKIDSIELGDSQKLGLMRCRDQAAQPARRPPPLPARDRR